MSKSFSTLFDTFRAAPFFRPLLQSADLNVGELGEESGTFRGVVHCLRVWMWGGAGGGGLRLMWGWGGKSGLRLHRSGGVMGGAGGARTRTARARAHTGTHAHRAYQSQVYEVSAKGIGSIRLDIEVLRLPGQQDPTCLSLASKTQPALARPARPNPNTKCPPPPPQRSTSS